MLTPEERKLLEIIHEKKLIRKSELEKLVKENNGIPLSTINSLLNKGFISNFSPLGEISFIMTNSGVKALKSES